MTTYVALLRGINVGAKNKVPMADLKAMFDALGYANVGTYIQSGNVVFSGTRVDAGTIETAISRTFGLDVPVVLRTKSQLTGVIDANPFLRGKADARELHVTFLAEKPRPAAVEALDPAQHTPDTFAIVGRDIFVRCPNGYGTTKINNTFFERKLSCIGTTRNWRTVVTLAEMSGAA